MDQATEKRTKRHKLWKLTYSDFDFGVYLNTYADTIVLDTVGETNVLAAVRFGGYAEQVRGMADAIYGGGTVTAEMDGETMTIHCLTKRYRRLLTNDEIYTEATLLIEDDRLKSAETDNNPSQKTEDMLVASFIFCEQDNPSRLFVEIDKKVSAPLIPEFQEYVICEAQRQNILRKLTVYSFREKFDAWKITLTKGEQNVIDVIETGLASGAIAIPKAAIVENLGENPFERIKTVSEYLNAFGVMIAEKIKGQFHPLFDPSAESLSNEVIAVNRHIKNNAGYSLYNAQLAEAESLKRRLDRSKFALCVAECGSGKTKIGSTALCAHQVGKGRGKTFNIVLCPSHLSKKWVREVEESLPNTFAVHIKSITDLYNVYASYRRGEKSCYIVITKEKARDGYMKRPAVVWNERQNAFLCPNCRQPIMMDVIDDGSKCKVEADQFFFQKENSKNHKCAECGHVLWTMLVPDQQSEWVKISNYGFIHRNQADVHFNALRTKVVLAQLRRERHAEVNIADNENGDAFDQDGKKIEFPKNYYDIKAVMDNPGGHFRAVGAYDRFALSTYIKRKMRGKIDGLIVDELQDYNNDSGQGDAMNELFCCAKKVIGLTGTLINGYSQGIFYLLYRISPHLMQIDDKKYTGTKEFNDEYGVTESVYEISGPEYNSNRRTIRKKLRERQLPGVSPLVYSRFLMDSTAFLSLNDMGKQLPEYEEIPVVLNMKAEVTKEYKRIEDEFVDVLKHEKKIANKVMSAFMSLLTVYPDQPYAMKPIINPITGATLLTPKDSCVDNTLNEKDLWLLEKVKEKIALGGKVIVYTSWIRIDTQQKLMRLFKENGIRADVLTSTTPPNKREEWVEKRVNDGIQVLITNPSLVETGLDLNDFPTLIYYNIGYKLFTLRQSSRRSWRINQRAPRVEVYFLCFKDVLQHRAMRLMASKLAVAGIIEGNFTDEGLAAMSECQDLTTLLAQELTIGIKNEIEDLNGAFKKMAILKPEAEPIQQAPDDQPENDLDTIQTIQLNILKESEKMQPQIAEAEQHIFFDIKEVAIARKPSTKKKNVSVDPNQLTLFDLLTASA